MRGTDGLVDGADEAVIVVAARVVVTVPYGVELVFALDYRGMVLRCRYVVALVPCLQVQ